jgi:hypothetical protein
VSPFVPIAKTAAAYASQAVDDPQYFDVEYVVNATARRVGWQGAGMPPANAKVFAQVQLSVMDRIPNDMQPPTDFLRDPTLAVGVRN